MPDIRRDEDDGETTDHLVPAMVAILERGALAVLATADAHGECDSSLRTGPPGFIRVLDERRVAYPEYRGNGVMASLGNIDENPHVGVLMVDFAADRRSLHLGGPARVVDDAELRAQHPDLPVDAIPGRRTDTWVVVSIDEATLATDDDLPHLEPVPRDRAWGTDAPVPKGGDFFGTAARRRAVVAAAAGPGGPSAPHGPDPQEVEVPDDAELPSGDDTRDDPPDGTRDRRGAAPARWRRVPGSVVLPGPRALVAVLSVLVVVLAASLVGVLAGGGSGGDVEPVAAPAPVGPTGPVTLYGRVVEIPDPTTVVVDVAGQRVVVDVLGIETADIPPCAMPGAQAFAVRTLDRQAVTLVPDPTVTPTEPRQAYVVLSQQLSYTDAILQAGWATPSGPALYRPVFDDERDAAEAAELGMFGSACGR